VRKLVPQGNIFLLDKLCIYSHIPGSVPLGIGGCGYAVEESTILQYDPAHGQGGNHYIPVII
jgi:hypothetical protein